MSRDSTIFYVYEHTRNDTGEVFYVGKGSGRRAYYSSGRNKYWHRISQKHGHSVRIISSGLDEETAFSIEAGRIDELRSSGVHICNVTSGGGGTHGYRHSEEYKEKMRGQSNPMRNPDVVAKITGGNHPMKKDVNANKVRGRKHTEDAKIKISESKIGVPRSQEMVEFLKARKMTDESRKKLSDSVRNTPKRECPHCGKESSPSNASRWHFDNCKEIVQNMQAVCHN